ncbi:Inhibitor of growth protein 2 [Trichoderma lentiforme]|uniref:Inhibitor of growth protein 2 n=1 Tax=Trichoderma lentiforme TaxID=1567552 RepID=A0A9P5C924_9HYPO|nr:Inhibitor of growth protein 2 [Trichoderma lentiforme]
MQRFRSVSNYITEVSRAKGDKVRVQEAVATVGEKSGLDDSNEPQYCLCNRGSVGIMIRCDNVDGCKYKWFHLECVGLTVAPSSKDKWYCPDCRGDVNIGEQADIDPRAFPPDSTNPEFAMDTEGER